MLTSDSREFKYDQLIQTSRVNSALSAESSDSDEDLNEESDDAYELEVYEAFEHGDVAKLLALKVPLHSPKYLQRAAQTGHLLTFLQELQIPLKHRSVALGNFDEAMKILLQTDRDSSQACKSRNIWQPDRKAQLLANFLWMPGQEPEVMMEKLLEEILVIRPSHVRRPHKELLVSAPPSLDGFPDVMCSFYIQRMFHWQPDELKYDKEKSLLEVRDKQASNPLSCIRVGRKVFPVMISQARKMYLHIPSKASKFAFLYPTDGFDIGGFLYLTESEEAVAVNKLCTEKHPISMFFGQCQHLGDDACLALRQQNRWETITIPEMLTKGAVEFAFVGPAEQLGDFKSGTSGGFAYKLNRSQLNEYRYFPIQGAGEIIERGWFVDGEELRAGSLDLFPSARDVDARLVHYPWLMSTLYHEFEITTARLAIPGLLHPVVLYSLLQAPRKQVLDTKAAKAIASAAFHHHMPMIMLSAIGNVASLVSLSWFTRHMREFPNENSGWNWASSLCFACIAVNLSKNLIEEALELYSCSQLGWLYAFCFKFDHLGRVTYVCVAVSLLTIFRHNGELPNSTSGRVLSAATGCMMWLRLLWSTRTVITWRLGLRVLPILGALSEAASFLLVMLFIFGASFQVSYSMTSKPFSTIIIDTYQMGFFGEMTWDLFVNPDSPPLSSEWLCELVAYMTFGFILMVSMANIFIQVMGQAYDRAKENAYRSFVHACLEVSMHCELVLKAVRLQAPMMDKYIWLAYKSEQDKDK